MATILYTTGEKKEVHPVNSQYFSLKELQAVVGGYIENLRIDDNRIMVLNEDGKSMHLPYNSQATLLVSSILLNWDYIVGDVIICEDKELE